MVEAVVERCLLWYDEALVVSARSGDGQALLAIAVEDGSPGVGWLAARVDEGVIEGVAEGRVDLRDALTLHRRGAALWGEFEGWESDRVELSEMAHDPEERTLPRPGFFLGAGQDPEPIAAPAP